MKPESDQVKGKEGLATVNAPLTVSLDLAPYPSPREDDLSCLHLGASLSSCSHPDRDLGRDETAGADRTTK